jgi:hypothetical protein
MGQYHIVVNLDRKEYINPHKVGCGLKQWEQLANHPGTGAALLVLLASHSTGNGGGDFTGSEGIIGRWRGERIAMVGDYDDAVTYPVGYLTDNPPDGMMTGAAIYRACDPDPDDGAPWTDVTDAVARVIEHELEGRYTHEPWTLVDQNGKRTEHRDGWRHFIDNADLAKAKKEKPNLIFPTDI